MTGVQKILLMALGVLAAALILSQLVLGQIIAGGNARLVKSHQHTGYLTVAVVLAYILLSIWLMILSPTRYRSGGDH